VTTISRVMSSHCLIRAHLERFRIVGDSICVCMMNYETVDLIWECSRFEVERRQLLLGLATVNIEEGTPIRDLCALLKWAPLKLCHRLLRECGLKNLFCRITGSLQSPASLKLKVHRKTQQFFFSFFPKKKPNSWTSTGKTIPYRGLEPGTSGIAVGCLKSKG
jgi:hypothetical protein